MSVRSFLDTNVLVYSDDHDEPDKRRIALELIARGRRDGTAVVSTQVLQEYFVTVTRKLGVEPSLARRKVELLARLGLVQVGLAEILSAIDLHRLHQISFWDALILEAARAAGCKVVYTEDLQSGAGLRGLEIVNPFASTAGR